MNGEQFIQWVMIVLAVEGITELLVQSHFFDPLRKFIFKRAVVIGDLSVEPRSGPFYWRFINSIFKCGYCMSVWVSMIGAIFTPTHLPLLINWLVSVIVLHRLSNFLHDFVTLVEKNKMIKGQQTTGSYTVQLHMTTENIEGNNGSIGPTGSTESLAD